MTEPDQPAAPAQEETGARAIVFEFEGIQGHQRRYITWLLEQCAPDVAPSDILAPDALGLLPEPLITPLQMQHYLARILEQARRFGEKPVTPTIVNATLAPDMHVLEPTLTRYGYNVPLFTKICTNACRDADAESAGLSGIALWVGRTGAVTQMLGDP
jgi:hypothetical protein